MTLQLSQEDLLILERQRLERFRSFFTDSLSFCFLFLDRQNELKIHCAEPWVVDLLLSDIEHVCGQAWMVVGAYQVSIYYAQEEIYTVATQSLSQRSQQSHDFPIAS